MIIYHNISYSLTSPFVRFHRRLATLMKIQLMSHFRNIHVCRCVCACVHNDRTQTRHRMPLQSVLHILINAPGTRLAAKLFDVRIAHNIIIIYYILYTVVQYYTHKHRAHMASTCMVLMNGGLAMHNKCNVYVQYIP